MVAELQTPDPRFVPEKSMFEGSPLLDWEKRHVVELRAKLNSLATQLQEKAPRSEAIDRLVAISANPKDYEKDWIVNGAGWGSTNAVAPTYTDVMLITQKANPQDALVIRFDTLTTQRTYQATRREAVKRRLEENGENPENFLSDWESQARDLQVPFEAITMSVLPLERINEIKASHDFGQYFGKDAVIIGDYPAGRSRGGGVVTKFGFGLHPYIDRDMGQTIEMNGNTTFNLHDLLTRHSEVIEFKKR